MGAAESTKSCKSCIYGAMEKISKNGGAPVVVWACDFFPDKRKYPTGPCVYWKQPLITVQQPDQKE